MGPPVPASSRAHRSWPHGSCVGANSPTATSPKSKQHLLVVSTWVTTLSRTHRHWRYGRRSTLLPGTHMSVTWSGRASSQPNPSPAVRGAVTGETSAAVPNSGGRAPTAGRLKTRPPPPALQSTRRVVSPEAARSRSRTILGPFGERSRSPHPLPLSIPANGSVISSVPYFSCSPFLDRYDSLWIGRPLVAIVSSYSTRSVPRRLNRSCVLGLKGCCIFRCVAGFSRPQSRQIKGSLRFGT